MRLAASTLALLVAVMASPMSAQESSRKDFEEFCEAIQGRWVGEVTWVTDWPGLGKKGEKVTCYFEGTIAEDGNVITGRWFGGSGSGTGLYYFDAGAKQINCVLSASVQDGWEALELDSSVVGEGFPGEDDRWVRSEPVDGRGD